MEWHDGMNNVSAKALDDDIPLFLRDDNTALTRECKAETHPSCTSASADAVAPPFWADENDRRHDRHYTTSSHECSALRELRVSGTRQETPDRFAASAAATLDVTGESGHRWRLTRRRILGKGSYGCATLYTQDGVSSGTCTNAQGDNSSVRSSRDKSSSSSHVSSSAAVRRTATLSPLQRMWVVVKDFNVQTMSDSVDESAAARREASILRACLGHPNVVSFVDFCDDAQRHRMMYLLLEYCAGGDLGRFINAMRHAHRLLSESFIASVLIQVAVALYSMHTEHRVLHRDVKPHNIFLCPTRVDGCKAMHRLDAHIPKRSHGTATVDDSTHTGHSQGDVVDEDDNGANDNDSSDYDTLLSLASEPVRVCVADLGIATVLDSVAGEARAACGSPFYMSPEMYCEKPYSTSTDVWSLGVVLYELLALERPFAATTQAALSRQVMSGTHTALTELQTTFVPIPYCNTINDNDNNSVTANTGVHVKDAHRTKSDNAHDSCQSNSDTGQHQQNDIFSRQSVRNDSRPRALPYSSRLLDLVESMLSVQPTARPTLRRVLRGAYVQEHLWNVPLAVRETAVYTTLFGPATLATGATPHRGEGNASNEKAKEDEAWNALYDDDDFEPEED